MRPIKWVNDRGEVSYQPVLRNGRALTVQLNGVEKGPRLYGTKGTARRVAKDFEKRAERDTWVRP